MAQRIILPIEVLRFSLFPLRLREINPPSTHCTMCRVDASVELTVQMPANVLERQPTVAFYWLALDQREPIANIPI